MRKIVTLSMVAAAALAVAACGKTETTNATDANAMVTEMNAGEALEGTATDTMTNTDGATGTTDSTVAATTNATDAATTNATDAVANSTNAM